MGVLPSLLYFIKKYFCVSDHFTFTTDLKFPQKYLMNNTWWVPGGPIFFYTGNEGVIEAFAENSGFMWDIAPEFNALLIFAEHRWVVFLCTNNMGFSSLCRTD